MFNFNSKEVRTLVKLGANPLALIVAEELARNNDMPLILLGGLSSNLEKAMIKITEQTSCNFERLVIEMHFKHIQSAKDFLVQKGYDKTLINLTWLTYKEEMAWLLLSQEEQIWFLNV